MSKRNYIPDVPRERIEELAKRIRPIRKFSKKGLCYVAPCDLFDVAYLWNAKAAEPCPPLVEMTTITTYHRFGHPMLFKPSIAEEFIKECVAFMVTNKPAYLADLYEDNAASNDGYHKAITALYRAER